uniref:DNA POLYMERASE n=1 Tax=Podoviridae sp. ctlpi2 TaxID=2826574 RepID=A0A8S5MLA4_9CAUD|nr:MAG TPA: DNA POLYMERASE [Podoviridae sp. ctlpi2]
MSAPLAGILNNPRQVHWGLPIVADFETYYDQDYSLSKLTTERYIRGKEFEMIGCSLKVGGEPTRFYRGEEVIPVLRRLVKSFPNQPFISHNTLFDMAILGLRYGIQPNLTVDTAVMAKLCGLDRVAGGASLAKLSAKLEEMGIVQTVKGTTVHDMKGVHMADMTEAQWQAYGKYCTLDSDLAYAVYMYCLPLVPQEELFMASLTTRMFTEPAFELDVPLLRQYAVKLEEDKQAMLSNLSVTLGFASPAELHKNLRSSAKFTALLERLGVDVPVKWSEKKQCTIPAVSKTDTEFLELLEHENPLVQAVVEAKLGAQSSQEQTRTATFLDIASRGKMPVPLRYAAAHTGRYGGCFVGETQIYVRYKRDVYEASGLHRLPIPYEWHMMSIPIRDLTDEHQVWDGEEWVDHGGLVCAGMKEYITWDGLTGTPGHQCFLAADSNETMSLEEFMQQNRPLVAGEDPFSNLMRTLGEDDQMRFFRIFDRLSRHTPRFNYAAGGSVLVFDILDCGPRKRYMANGKLVHNSDKVNVQNLSKRNKDPMLRRSMTAGRGEVVLAVDSSQIECRVNAYLSRQEDLTALFLEGGDPYSDMGAAIFGKTYDEVYHAAKVEGSKEGKHWRAVGKQAVLSCGYGMSAATFKYRMELEGNAAAAEAANHIVNTYRMKNTYIVGFWKTCQRVLDIMYAGAHCSFGGKNQDLFYADGASVFHGVRIPSIRLPNGTYIFYQNLRKEADADGKVNYVYDQMKGRKFVPTRMWGSKCCENLCQALAFAALKWQALEIARRGVPIHLNVHDEWVSVVPRDAAPKAMVVYYECMKKSPPYLPDGLLDCEVDAGPNYADLKTIDVGKILEAHPCRTT